MNTNKSTQISSPTRNVASNLAQALCNEEKAETEHNNAEAKSKEAWGLVNASASANNTPQYLMARNEAMKQDKIAADLQVISEEKKQIARWARYSVYVDITSSNQTIMGNLMCHGFSLGITQGKLIATCTDCTSEVDLTTFYNDGSLASGNVNLPAYVMDRHEKERNKNHGFCMHYPNSMTKTLITGSFTFYNLNSNLARCKTIVLSKIYGTDYKDSNFISTASDNNLFFDEHNNRFQCLLCWMSRSNSNKDEARIFLQSHKCIASSLETFAREWEVAGSSSTATINEMRTTSQVSPPSVPPETHENQAPQIDPHNLYYSRGAHGASQRQLQTPVFPPAQTATQPLTQTTTNTGEISVNTTLQSPPQPQDNSQLKQSHGATCATGVQATAITDTKQFRNEGASDQMPRTYNTYYDGVTTIYKKTNSEVIKYTAQYPENAQLSNRRDGYLRCNHNTSGGAVNTNLCAEAGLFCCGDINFGKCYFCGSGLKEWDEEDDAWEMHAWLHPKCAYLLLSKGQDYVNEILERKGLTDKKDMELATYSINEPRKLDSFSGTIQGATSASALSVVSSEACIRKTAAMETLTDEYFHIKEKNIIDIYQALELSGVTEVTADKILNVYYEMDYDDADDAEKYQTKLNNAIQAKFNTKKTL